MLPFVDPRDFHALNSGPCYSISIDGQFEASFSSSGTPYDQCYTPSRRGSSRVSDLDGISSSTTSFESNGPNSPVDATMFYSLVASNNMVKSEEDKSHLYITPCHKSIQDHSMMNYDFSQANSMYGPLDFQQGFEGLPEMTFDNLPGFLFHDTTSGLPMTSSPDNFVVPSQTFISEPYRPTTPTNMSKVVLGSPLEDYSQTEEIKYFMSPRESHSRTPSSVFSSASHSTLRGSPSSQTLEISAALHRIQLIGSSRISKQPKRSPQVTSKIGRVAAGLFRCDKPGCKSEHGFKRHEHLKRHQRTHEASKPLHCQFCRKQFQLDRHDNYKAHVKLHTKDKKGSRTKYYPEAQAVVDYLEKKRPAEKDLDVPGEMYRMYTRRVKAGVVKGGMTKSRL
jgi:hypothetical protein